MKQTEEYYYGRMPKDKQNVYRAVLHGLMELSDEFLIPQVPTTDGNWLYDVFFQLRLDHPEIFWAVGFKYRYYKDSPNLILIPEYIFDKNKIREHQKALGARIDKLVRTAMKFSEWDKEKYVHDFICENIRYDKLKKPYSHEIIGPLGHGVGVCEGIAKSVKVLCDALGVWCIIAICGNNPEKGIKYRHTWNIVRINGQYYHLDATFDNTLGKNEDGSTSIRYDYFNLDDKNIFRDHEPLIAPAPPLPGWKPLLLPREKAVLHQIGRRIQTCPPGRKKRPRIHLPLARRISHPRSPRRPCRSDPGRRKDTGQKSHHHTQLASGCTAISFCGTAGGREGVY